MSYLNVLIVEGNIREDSEFFIKAAGASAADNLKNLILKLEPSTNTDIINPGHDNETSDAIKSNLNILIIEGNIREDSEFFIKAAGASASDNLKNLILKLEPSTNADIINPGHDDETSNAIKNMSKYNGIVFTGGAMRINDMTDVIKKHINFASNCLNQNKKILAICWGLQVCSTAAGGKVNPGKNGAHIGIASDVIINNEGMKAINILYIMIKKKNLQHPHLTLMKLVSYQKMLFYYQVIKLTM